jgi:hypothetical protein
MSLNLPLVFKTEDLIARLKAKLPAAKKKDERAMVAHRKAEQAFLDKFKQGCRDALKWDYGTAKNAGFSPIGGRSYHYGPSCPQSEEERLKRMISLVEHSAQKRFTLTSSGKYSLIYQEMTKDIPAQKGAMC